MNFTTAIIIPARYGSTRFPGKPLALLAGKTVLEHVVALARAAAGNDDSVSVHVTTDDDRIAAEAERLAVSCLRTSPDCPTGTDRVMEAARQIERTPGFVINLQGDAPLTPPGFVTAMISAFAKAQSDIVTPVVQLRWDELDTLRTNKKETPFSGTTAVMDAAGRALWFSKNIIPAIRKEAALKAASPLSPVHRHIGLYGYSYEALETYVTLRAGVYEELEGLEQLRALENGMSIQCVKVDYQGRPSMSGIDSPEDLARAERLLGLMIARVTAAAVLVASLLLGLWVQDASDPLMMVPFLLLAGWLAASGALIRLDLRDPALIGLLLLWLIWGVSVLHSAFPFNSLVTWIIMGTLPLSYMVWRAADFPEKAQRLLLLGFLSLSLLLSLSAIAQVTILPNPVWPGRASFPFLDPNMLGLYLGLSLLPVVPLVMKKDMAPRPRLFLLASLVLLLAGLMATQSRSALLGILAGLGMIAALSWKDIPRTRRSLAAFTVCALAGLAMLLYTGFLSRFGFVLAGGDTSIGGRFSLWRTAFGMSLNHPLTGTGFGTFGLYYPAARQPGGDYSAGWWVHMDPLQWAVEFGWLAPLCFYALVIYIAVKIRASVRAQTLSPLHTGFAASLLCLFLNAHTAYPLHVIPFMLFATFMMAALLPAGLPAAVSPLRRYAFAFPLLLVLCLTVWTGIKTGATLQLWKETNAARRAQDKARFSTYFEACLRDADPRFAYCRLLQIELILASPYPPSAAVKGLIEASRAYNSLLPQPDYYLATYYRKTEPDHSDLEIQALKDSLAKNPTFWLARRALVEILEKENRFAEALEVLETGSGYPLPQYDRPYYNQKLADLRLKAKALP